MLRKGREFSRSFFSSSCRHYLASFHASASLSSSFSTSASLRSLSNVALKSALSSSEEKNQSTSTHKEPSFHVPLSSSSSSSSSSCSSPSPSSPPLSSSPSSSDTSPSSHSNDLPCSSASELTTSSYPSSALDPLLEDYRSLSASSPHFNSIAQSIASAVNQGVYPQLLKDKVSAHLRETQLNRLTLLKMENIRQDEAAKGISHKEFYTKVQRAVVRDLTEFSKLEQQIQDILSEKASSIYPSRPAPLSSPSSSSSSPKKSLPQPSNSPKATPFKKMLNASETANPSTSAVQSTPSSPLSSNATVNSDNFLLSCQTLLRNIPYDVLLNFISSREPQKIEDLIEQVVLEAYSLQEAADQYEQMSKQLVSMRQGSSLKPAQKILVGWYAPLVKAIEKEVKAIKNKDPGFDREVYGPYFLALPPSKLACICMSEVLNLVLMAPQNCRFQSASLAIGNAVNMEAKLAVMNSNRGDSSGKKNIPKSKSGTTKLLKDLQKIKDNAWNDPVKIKIGACLIQLLLATAYFPNPLYRVGGNPNEPRNLPAFTHAVVVNKSATIKHVGYIFCHEQMLKSILKELEILDVLRPQLLPMVVRPLPWTAYDEGGYLSARQRVMRVIGSHQQQWAIRKAEIPQVYKGLNYLSATPWHINGRILDVVEALLEEGGGVAGLPSQHDVPPPDPPALDPATKKANPADQKQYKRLLDRTKVTNANLHSLRCDTQYKLQVARRFRTRTIHFPFNIDFRGRAYPIPPHLNHLGNDMSRGLLLFAEKKPLGPDGLRWLKIHLATLFGGGIDKLPFQQRVAWAEKNMDNVFKSAEDPLCNKEHRGRPRWWLQAEDPFQFLAACFEITNALKSPDPTAFLSELPVHQDGSCNGLQHYAALGRDVEGAVSVNLVPSDRPQDVYMGVCNRVNRQLELDAEAGVTSARLLLGKVTRKVVKQTVMTSVYGVTNIGARDQIRNRLKERTDIEWPEPAESAIGEASMYLAKLTLSQLYEAFAGARRIQDWLGSCAYKITNHACQPVNWVTPLGLPVIQPYRRVQLYQVRTVLQSVSLIDNSDLLPVSSIRQKSAFPPNFIHSLDASHMLLTALRCQEQGIVFSAVHDSFWTHAGSVNQMNACLREEFVKLYNQPILENLRDAWMLQFPEIEFDPLPSRGNLQLEEVLSSPYFFA